MIFNELDHRLSMIKRWNIVHTLQSQSVAEHALNVTRIADRVAVEWFDIVDSHLLLEINRYAQHHDDLESVMGDPPSMIKDCIDEDKVRERYKDMIPVVVVAQITREIVKLADMIEAIIFLRIELSLGNESVRLMSEVHENRIHRYLAVHRHEFIPKYQQLIHDMFPNGKLIAQPNDRRPAHGPIETSAAGSFEERKQEAWIRVLFGDGAREDAAGGN